MKPALEEPERRAQPPLWAQVRGWAIALTSVAMLIGLLDARPDIQQGVLIAILVTEWLLPWMILSVVIMFACLMGLLWWVGHPKQGILIRTGSVICVTMLGMALGLLGLKHLSRPFHLVGIVLYMGVGSAMLLFVQNVIPVWEDRGFLRHPKPAATLDDTTGQV